MNNERKFNKGHIVMCLDMGHRILFKQNDSLDIVRLASGLKEWLPVSVRYLLHLKLYRPTTLRSEYFRNNMFAYFYALNYDLIIIFLAAVTCNIPWVLKFATKDLKIVPLIQFFILKKKCFWGRYFT